jgi:hypothetical protein
MKSCGFAYTKNPFTEVAPTHSEVSVENETNEMRGNSEDYFKLYDSFPADGIYYGRNEG